MGGGATVERDWAGTTGDGYDAIVRRPTGGEKWQCRRWWPRRCMVVAGDGLGLEGRARAVEKGASACGRDVDGGDQVRAVQGVAARCRWHALGKHWAGQACFSNKGPV